MQRLTDGLNGRWPLAISLAILVGFALLPIAFARPDPGSPPAGEVIPTPRPPTPTPTPPRPGIVPVSLAASECLVGENFAISQESGQQEAPAIAYNEENGEYLVAWESESPSADWDICGQVVSSGGSVPGDRRFCLAEPDDQRAADVAYNGGDDVYLLVWQDHRDGDWDIYGKSIPVSGVLGDDGSRIVRRVERGNHQQAPALAYNSQDNDYLVVWQDDWCEAYPYTTPDNIYGGKVDGAIRLRKFVTISEAGNSQEAPAVAYNSRDKQYLVVWEDFRHGNWDIYGQLVSAAGDPLGGNFAISDILKDQRLPAVAYNSQDNVYLVVWQDNRDGNWDIYGRRISADGGMHGDFPISRAAGSQQAPVVAYNGQNNEYLVAWQDGRGDDEDIYGQRVSNEDKLLGGECPISVFANDQEHPDVAYNSQANEYLVVWQDERNGEDNDDIYGQRVAPSPTPTPTNTPTPTQEPRCLLCLPIIMKNHLIPAPTPACSNYIQNPGFEAGSAYPWVISGRTEITNQRPSHAGNYCAWLGGYNNTCDDLHQGNIAVPTKLTSATLTFWYYLHSEDKIPGSDHFNVYIRNSVPPQACPAETSILAVVATMDNTCTTNNYVQYTYSFKPADLEAIRRAGGNIQVYFEVTTNEKGRTAVFIDDVILEICQ